MAVDDACKLFVAGLPESITETVLQQLFEAAGGNVVEISLPRDRATGRPRGFGFVTLSSEQEAKAARQSLDGSMQSGRSISVRAFQAGPRRTEPRSDRPPMVDRGGGGGGGGGRGSDDRTLYLGNLPYDATPADVEAMLDQAGVSATLRVNLPLDPTGRPRGFGFVTLGSADAAETAVALLREVELKGRRISASIAHGRNERASKAPHSAPRASEGPPPSPRPDARRYQPRDSFDAPSGPPPNEGGGGPPAESDEEGEGRGRGRRKVAKGKKKGVRGAADRGRTRRENEGLRAPRARDWLDDEDD